jgi:hypothetical protein
MTSNAQPPALVPFDGARIPQSLKDMPRWAPWRAIWSEKKQKYDKVPYRADTPHIGLSTKDPERWFTYAAALRAFQKQPGKFAGLGFCMTSVEGIVGVDLDKCIVGGQTASWANEIVHALDSYSEISPSGKGLRIFVMGEIESDWNNHEVGIEVYAGHQARFLTITGAQLPNTPNEVNSEATHGYLAELSLQYAKERTKSTVEDLDMPDILDELALPSLADLTLPDEVVHFLETGEHDGDGSAVLNLTGISLYTNGLTDDVVFSFLANNEHALGIALSHRRDDSDRALAYLWQHHCLQAKSKGISKIATVDDFEDLTPKDAQGVPIPKKVKYQFEQADDFSQAKPVEWLIKKVLPKSEIGVLYGPSGAGKTFFTLDLVLAVAQGEPWRDMRVKQGTVAYICAEGAGGFRLRLKAYAEHHGKALKDIPVWVLGGAPNFTQPQDVKQLVDALKLIPNLSLIVVDTWAQVTAGADENSGKEMGTALASCKRLHAATGAMVLLVAHSGKDEARGMRGWSGVKGAIDVEIQVERLTERSRQATITKMKDGDGESTSYGFHLVSVGLGTDADGDPVTSCVVGFDGEQVRLGKAPRIGLTEQLLLDTLESLMLMGGTVTSGALIDAAVSQIPLAPGKRDQRRTPVSRALTTLEEKKVLSTEGGIVKLVDNMQNIAS